MMVKINDGELRAIWQQHGTDGPSTRSVCLTDEAWGRLLSKEATSDERAHAVVHIAACAECADEYRRLQPLQEWSAELQRTVSPRRATVLDRVRSWFTRVSLPSLAFATAAATILVGTQAIGVYLLMDSRRQTAQLETELERNERDLSSTKTSLTDLQAQLRSRSAMSEEQVKALQGRLAQRTTPQFDPVTIDLEPQAGGLVRRSGDAVVPTAQADSMVVLTLSFEPLPSRSTLEVEVVDPDGQVRWTGRTVRDRSAESLSLTLPTEGYPPGRYVIRLNDVTRDRRPLASYRLTLRNAAGPAR